MSGFGKRKLPPDNAFHICFQTKGLPTSMVRAVKVVLEDALITDMDESVYVNLADHPLYSELVDYVRANPR